MNNSYLCLNPVGFFGIVLSHDISSFLILPSFHPSTHFRAARFQKVQPIVGDRPHCLVALHQRVSEQKLGEDLFLEPFHQLKLAPALQLKAFQLRQGAIVLEDRVALLEELALFGGGREHHGAIRAVHLDD